MLPAKLLSYREVRERISGTSHLLLGNGFSVACDPIFKYDRLYDSAIDAGLSARAQAVFSYLGTNNFEGVMRLLDDSHWVAETYKLIAPRSSSEMLADVAIVKQTLIRAVAESHLAHTGKVSDDKKAAAREFLRPYHNVFTTNYDLLLYWVVMSVSPILFQDGFRDDEEDSSYVVFAERLGKNRGIFYLHGALHLYLAGGELRKHCWSRTRTPLTELIKNGLQVKHYPLFVAEGAADQKLQQIQRSGYLWYCLDKLARIASPLVIFGHSLGESDHHIVDVLAENPDLPEIYLGVFGGPGTSHAAAVWQVAEDMKAKRAKLRERRRSAKDLKISYFASESASVWKSDVA